MAGFEHGEKLTCLTKVKVNDKTFQAGDDFPYIDLNVDPSLVDSLLSQRKIARAAHVSQQMLAELKVDRTEKIIRNYEDGRVAVSWPDSEPLPLGVIDGRPEHLRGPVGDEEYSAISSSEDSGASSSESSSAKGIKTDKDGFQNNEHVQVVESGTAGFFNVIVDGIQVNPKKLRRAVANKLAEEYK